MTPLLLRHAVRVTMPCVLVAFGLCYLVFGESEALGALVGGVLAGVNFFGIIYLVGELLGGGRPQGAPRRKLPIFLILVKLVVVGTLLWAALAKGRVGGVGLIFGIGAAIMGFSVGLTRATASAEGQAAIAAEEARLAREAQESADDRRHPE